MAEFKTQAPDIKPTSGSFFRPTANNSNADAIASLAQTAGTLMQFADQKHTQKVVSGFARNLDDIFLDAANASLSDSNMSPLSDAEIKSLNTTQGRINLIRKMESNRQGLSSLQHRLIAEERKALAANPRLAPEIQQMFRSATGTTSGQMAMSIVNDQAGVDIQNQMLAMAGPDQERVANEEREAEIRKLYSIYNSDYQTADLEKQSKWYYNFQAEQLRLANLKASAEAKKLAGENSENEGNSLIMGGVLQDLTSIRALLGGRTAADLAKLPREEREQAYQNLDTLVNSLKAKNIAVGGQFGAKPTVINMVNGLLDDASAAAKKQAGGEYSQDISGAMLSVTQNIAKNDLLNTVDLDGNKLADTVERARIADTIPALLEKIDKSPAAKAAFDRLNLGLWGATTNADGYKSQFGNIPASDIAQQMDLLTTFINTTINNPETFGDEQTLMALNGIVGAFYTNNITHGGAKLSDERLAIVGHSSLKLLSNPKFTEFLTKNPVISSGFLTIAQDYAQAFAERTSAAAASVVSTSFNKAGALGISIPKELTLDDLVKKTQVGNSIVLAPKYTMPSQLERALLPMFREYNKKMIKQSTIFNQSNAILFDSTGEYANTRARSFKIMFDEVQRRITEFNASYATNISKLAQARLNLVPGLNPTSTEDFLDAVDVVMGLTEDKYLFTPPPPKDSQTQ